MGAMKSMYTDTEELLGAVAEDAWVDGVFDQGALLDSLRDRGWLTPTEKEVAVRAFKDGQMLRLARILGVDVATAPVELDEAGT